VTVKAKSAAKLPRLPEEQAANSPTAIKPYASPRANEEEMRADLAVNLFRVTKMHLSSKRDRHEEVLRYKELTRLMPNADQFLRFAAPSRPMPVFDVSREDFVTWTLKHSIANTKGSCVFLPLPHSVDQLCSRSTTRAPQQALAAARA
jgi:hypothetical protein